MSDLRDPDLLARRRALADAPHMRLLATVLAAAAAHPARSAEETA